MPCKIRKTLSRLEKGVQIQNRRSASSISAATGMSRSLLSNWKRTHVNITDILGKRPKTFEGPKNDDLLQAYNKQTTKRKHTRAPLLGNTMLPGSPPKISKTDGADQGLSDEQKRLNTQWVISQMTGKGIKMVRSNCETICMYIKNQSSKILDVWPAYDSREKNCIKFVVTIEEDIDLKEMKLEYAIVVRSVHEFSHEAVVVMETEKDGKYRLSDEDSEKIKEAIKSIQEN